MPSRPLLVILLLFGIAAGCAEQTAPPTVDASSQRSIASGDLVGFTGSYGSHAWKGIPYAAPPVGDLRWRAPRATPSWSATREALATGEACPQYASVFSGEGRDASGVMGEEDCLYLDVYAPRFEPDEVPTGDARLPVMFWIHGGSNVIGRAGFYDGGNLAATHDVVVVAINYRLGPFGWFRHDALRAGAESDADRSGNFGTLDMIQALEWVQANIASFGGDPGRVMIFGESAGGNDVFTLLLSPLAKGLFHRAGLQSPGMGTSTPEYGEAFFENDFEQHRQSSNEILLKLIERDGLAADRDATRAHLESMDAAAVAAYLRGKSPADLLSAYDTEETEGMINVPALFRDGHVLPGEDPSEIFRSGTWNQVPILVGTNRDENKLFMVFDPRFAVWRFGLFPRPLDADVYQATSDHQANAWKARAVDGFAASLHEVGGLPVYAYRWDWDEEPGVPLLASGAEMIGAAHGLEIPFVFGHWDLGPQTSTLFDGGNAAGRETLSAQMMSYWAEFAYSGSPGRGRGGDLPEWLAFDGSSADAPKFIVLDTPADGGPRLSSETVTIEGVVAAIAADERLSAPHEKCTVLRNLAAWEYYSVDEYHAVNGGLCASYAFDQYPWTAVAAGE